MECKQPLVSAIITTYKRQPELIRRALESVLNQTYANVELIVVDDSPADFEFRDEVKALCESYGERVRYERHEKNLGACAARNTGIDKARGEFVACLDDDDEWLPTKIEKQLRKFDSDKIGLVYCGNFIVDEKRGVRYEEKRPVYVGAIFSRLILCNIIGSTSFALCRRDVVVEVGKFDVEMPAAQDYDLWLRIAERYEVMCVDEPLVNYFIHDGEQITQSKTKKATAYRRLLQKHAAYLKKHPKARAIRLLRLAVWQMYDNWFDGVKLWIKAFCAYPFVVGELYGAAKGLVYVALLEKKRKEGRK